MLEDKTQEVKTPAIYQHLRPQCFSQAPLLHATLKAGVFFHLHRKELREVKFLLQATQPVRDGPGLESKAPTHISALGQCGSGGKGGPEGSPDSQHSLELCPHPPTTLSWKEPVLTQAHSHLSSSSG